MSSSSFNVPALAAIAALCALLAGSAAKAQIIPIINAGFEEPATSGVENGAPPGWTLTGSGGGVWNINASPLGFWNESAPEGNQVGWLAPDSRLSGPAAFSQMVPATFQINTLYTLGFDVGIPLGFGTSPDASTFAGVQILAGGNNVFVFTQAGFPEGVFFPSFLAVSFTESSSQAAFVGLPLEIRLFTNQPQVAFDNITLTAESSSTAAPEPATLALLATGLLPVAGAVIRRRQRKV